VAGDHALIIGNVVNVYYNSDIATQKPLLYYRSAFGAFQPENSLQIPQTLQTPPIPEYQKKSHFALRSVS
jgi:hypothetical protein